MYESHMLMDAHTSYMCICTSYASLKLGVKQYIRYQLIQYYVTMLVKPPSVSPIMNYKIDVSDILHCFHWA